jgi:hypothetical protein
MRSTFIAMSTETIIIVILWSCYLVAAVVTGFQDVGSLRQAFLKLVLRNLPGAVL